MTQLKTYLLSFCVLAFILSSCVPAPSVEVEATQTPLVATRVVSTATITIPSPATSTPAPTSMPVALPRNLVITYIVEDSLWLWKENNSQLLGQQLNISTPVFSDDGQWLLYRQRHISVDGSAPTDEVWIARTDGSELQRLLGPDDIAGLTDEKLSLLIDDIAWRPGHHEILFNTEKIIAGPPGSWPLYDLYSLDLSGQVTRLLVSGAGGKFIPSPTGMHVTLVTDSRIGVLDLANGEQRTLLEFKAVGIPSDNGPATPEVVWDPQGHFIMTAILPENLYYPEKYAGEPTQVWKLLLNGQVELVAELQLVARFAGIVFSPNLQYFSYLNSSCLDGMGKLQLHNVESGEEIPLDCVWEYPQWTPDGQHFIFQLDGLWQLGSIVDNTKQPLNVLNAPNTSPRLTWIDEKYFLLTLSSQSACTLSVATLQGVVTEIAHTPSYSCPRANFILSR